MGSQEPKRFNVGRIAIVGAGPCALAAAKYLRAQNAFETIDIFEQQAEVGGVWNYSPVPSKTVRVPQVSADGPADPPLPFQGEEAPIFPSPMYDVLHTNIPRDLMRYTDLPIREDALIFPSREHVQEYVVEYAKDIRHLIRFSTQVKDIRLREEVDGRDQWDVDTECLVTGKATTATYDAVVVASGHYTAVYIPEIAGIREFHEAHPGVISHSKHYRTPAPFADKKVVIVGNAASGLDIAAQISPVCQKPLLLSVQSPTSQANLDYSGAEEVPVIEELLVAERGIRLQDGRVEKDIDAVIFATGYLFAFPFLKSLKPPLVTDGRRVHGLYKHLMHIDHPTLVFMRLPIKVTPLPVSESQAAVVARTWANLLPLPPVEEMKEWEEEEAERQGAKFHVWGEDGDANYINSVHDLITRSGTQGKEPPYWSPELRWQRQIYAKAKLQFELDGRKATTLEELGFRYAPDGEDS
jgi:cation diffusion facilitator CzcD-associated flavoprotein CzcO